jgi:hypothetical protein
MRPLDVWRGKAAVERMATPEEVDAFTRAFDADAALGVQPALTGPEREALTRRRAELLEQRLRAQRDALRR